jgi:hypothetical protein
MENEELTTDIELETEDAEPTQENVVDDGKSEFEYDEDGNVIVPDIPADDEDEDEEIDISFDDEETVTEESEESAEEETETATETHSEEQKPEEKTEAEQPLTARERALQEKLEALERQTRDTLKKLGVKDEGSPLEGLQKIAAEASDMTLDEYKKKTDDERTLAEAQNLIRQQKFAQLKAADLSELKKAFPHLADVTDLETISNFRDFAAFRDKGLTPKQAYVAANPDEAATRAESYNKAKARNDSKAHLRSAVPVAAKDNSIRMSKQELEFWRDLFNGTKTDKEIAVLYAKTKPRD